MFICGEGLVKVGLIGCFDWCFFQLVQKWIMTCSLKNVQTTFLGGFGGIGYLMLVYVQTVSVILGVFPTLPATLVSGVSAKNWAYII